LPCGLQFALILVPLSASAKPTLSRARAVAYDAVRESGRRGSASRPSCRWAASYALREEMASGRKGAAARVRRGSARRGGSVGESGVAAAAARGKRRRPGLSLPDRQHPMTDDVPFRTLTEHARALAAKEYSALEL